MKVAVLGAGPGAFALSACLSLKNYDVRLYEQPEYRDNIECLSVERTISIDGYVKGTTTLSLVTTNLRAAVEGADFIFVVSHAVAHRPLAGQLAPLLRDGQVVVLLPGYVAGGISFENELKKNAPALDVNILESSVLPFACRKTGHCSVFVGGWKSDFLLSARDTDVEIPPIEDLFGHLPISPNRLETGLNETNFIIHPCISLLNVGLVEGNRDWAFYRDGLTPAIGRLIEEADGERLALMAKLGFAQTSIAQWLTRFYGHQGASGQTVYDILKNYDYFATSKGPTSFAHRYFSEDVPYGLVPMAALGRTYGVSMPVTGILIDLACRLCGVDYRSTGRMP